MRPNQTFTHRVEFFLAHGGTSYRPDTQSEYAGKLCGAMALAAAERWVHDETNYAFNWERDNDSDGDTELWVCMLVTALGHGNTLTCCGAIDLGNVGPDDHHSDPYQRVMEAELALEAMELDQHARSSIPLEAFKALSHAQKLELFESLAVCAAFLDLDVLRALCMWNDPNGDYDELTRTDLCDLVSTWCEEG